MEQVEKMDITPLTGDPSKDLKSKVEIVKMVVDSKERKFDLELLKKQQKEAPPAIEINPRDLKGISKDGFMEIQGFKVPYFTTYSTGPPVFGTSPTDFSPEFNEAIFNRLPLKEDEKEAMLKELKIDNLKSQSQKRVESTREKEKEKIKKERTAKKDRLKKHSRTLKPITISQPH